MTTDVLLEARGITRALGEGDAKVMALKGVTLSLWPGDLTLLMGPSGSGKTTLLSIFGCILAPTEGTLTVAGQSTAGMNAEQLADLRRKRIGFIFQSYNLFPTLTAEENVMLALDVRRKPVSDPRASGWPLPDHWPAIPRSSWPTSQRPRWTASTARQ